MRKDRRRGNLKRRHGGAHGFPFSRPTSSSGLRTPNSRAPDGPGDSHRDRPHCSIDHHRAASGGDPREVRVQLVLAEITAIGRVRAVVWPLELTGMDDLVVQSELVCDLQRKAAVPFRIARAVRRDGQCAVAKRVVGHVGQLGAVDSAAISNDDRPDRGERRSQRACLLHHSSGSLSS
jgi:hypothetical protein